MFAEGAGSPVEVKSLWIKIYQIFYSYRYTIQKIIFSCRHRKRWSFASIWEFIIYFQKILRKNVIGVIVNKFRGDLTLFDEGIRIIRRGFQIPVLGVLPYIPFNLGFEDSASLKNFVQNPKIKTRYCSNCISIYE